MKMSSLLTLVEGAQGYNGGNYVDEMPHLSLTECIGGLTESIMAQQIELHESAMAQNDALVEAAVSAIQTGSSADFGNLVEMSFADIKAKVKKVFDSIIKFLKSIIAKLTLQIDKIRMTGHQLYTKYKDSPMLKNKKFADLTVNGYKFSKNEKLFPAAAQYEGNDGAEKLIKQVGGSDKVKIPSEFAAAYATDAKNKGNGQMTEKQAQKAIDGIKDLSRATRVFNMAKALTGSSKISESSWESDLRQELYGEKVDLKYGTDFTLDSVAELLKEPANLNLIKDEYVKLEKSVNAYRDQLQRELDKVESDRGNADNTNEVNEKLSLHSAYYSAYMSLISDAYGVINKVKGIKYNFEKAKVDQAKTLFAKMLSYKAAKEDADEIMADADDFDFEV